MISWIIRLFFFFCLTLKYIYIAGMQIECERKINDVLIKLCNKATIDWYTNIDVAAKNVYACIRTKHYQISAREQVL